mgnify:CR=1 FL=1
MKGVCFIRDLFSSREAALSPLADGVRPRTLGEFIGQGRIVGPGRLLRRAIEADRMTSSIFYGPAFPRAVLHGHVHRYNLYNLGWRLL